jgi:hypothetical protein
LVRSGEPLISVAVDPTSGCRSGRADLVRLRVVPNLCPAPGA